MGEIQKFLRKNGKKVVLGLIAVVLTYLFMIWFLEMVTRFKTHSRPMTQEEMRETAPR